MVKAGVKDAAPTSADCIGAFGIACYAPADLQNQYDFTGAYENGWDGTGQTIVIFDPFGSPTIQQDLSTFDEAFGLPAPPSFKIYEPEGHVTYQFAGKTSPANNNKHSSYEVNAAYETSLDVEWAHAMAPGASIALVQVPVKETEGVQGAQNLLNAQQWALDHHLGNIWSNSWGATEQSFDNSAVVKRLDQTEAGAAAQDVNAFYATGDSGVANVDKHLNVYPFPTVIWPASSPNTIAVGGTEIPTPVDSISSYQPESAWNDFAGAGGGGFSTIFGKPSFQNGAVPGSMRGLPDVSYNAALISSILVYESFDPQFGAGWALIGGTSAAAPQWAAVAAVAQQAKGGALGALDPQLYALAGTSAFHDITDGDNGALGITGYQATSGWDAATGLGTPDVAVLAQDLSQ